LSICELYACAGKTKRLIYTSSEWNEHAKGYQCPRFLRTQEIKSKRVSTSAKA
jgi:hypothetical protein